MGLTAKSDVQQRQPPGWVTARVAVRIAVMLVLACTDIGPIKLQYRHHQSEPKNHVPWRTLM